MFARTRVIIGVLYLGGMLASTVQCMVPHTSAGRRATDLQQMEQLSRSIRRQAAFRTPPERTTAHLRIARATVSSPLAAILKQPLSGPIPSVRIAADTLYLTFGNNDDLITITPVPASKTYRRDVFMVSHNGKAVYMFGYLGSRECGDLLNIIIDRNRFSFAETPFSRGMRIARAAHPVSEDARKPASPFRSRLSQYMMTYDDNMPMPEMEEEPEEEEEEEGDVLVDDEDDTAAFVMVPMKRHLPG